MADLGPGPPALIEKRIQAQIAQHRHTQLSQELEIMELQEKIARLEENIEATNKQIKERENDLDALKKSLQAKPPEAVNG